MGFYLLESMIFFRLMKKIFYIYLTILIFLKDYLQYKIKVRLSKIKITKTHPDFGDFSFCTCCDFSLVIICLIYSKFRFYNSWLILIVLIRFLFQLLKYFPKINFKVLINQRELYNRSFWAINGNKSYFEYYYVFFLTKILFQFCSKSILWAKYSSLIISSIL